ncbi:hypothetical protein HNY73_017317 [Argiope bruennichi]|uniref:Uncharacterized protein n=1 Tax=Argiope bruennichi TaxID=94029 RepID=A0A8T0EN08_ARGBR|nr:hypothetical protein HNY73_017317 [Argiope bruennichi]
MFVHSINHSEQDWSVEMNLGSISINSSDRDTCMQMRARVLLSGLSFAGIRLKEVLHHPDVMTVCRLMSGEARVRRTSGHLEAPKGFTLDSSVAMNE